MLVRQGLPCGSGQELLQIDWKLLSACNCRCSYCFDQHKPENEDICAANIFKTAQKILGLERERFLFRFVGGEPTLFAPLRALMEYILSRKSDKVFFEIITNGSAAPRYFTRLFARLPEHVCRVHLSVHLEYAKKSHIARLLETIAALRQHAVARVMFHPRLTERSADFTNFLHWLRGRVPFEIRVLALRQAPEFIDFDARYSRHDLKAMNFLDSGGQEAGAPGFEPPMFYDENGIASPLPHSQAYRNGFCDFKGFTCLAGVNTLHIEPDLRWRPATCFLFARSARPFFMEEENLVPIAKKCDYARCGCDANYIIPKFRDYGDAMQYLAQIRQRRTPRIIPPHIHSGQ